MPPSKLIVPACCTANWIVPAGCDVALMQDVGKHFAWLESNFPGQFPNLCLDQDLLLSSDYSGEHNQSNYQVATYLLTNSRGMMAEWEAERLAVRRTHLPAGSIMAFKELNDGQRQRALVPFLKAASKINGIIFCVAFDKSLLHSDLGFRYESPDPAMKEITLAKITRIAVMGALLVGGLSCAGQNLWWITDEDDIVSNERVRRMTSDLFGGLLHGFCAHGLNKCELGVAGEITDGEHRAEDICSIPDLVGGMVAESLTLIGKDNIPGRDDLFQPEFVTCSVKSQIILSWFSSLRGPLTRLLCVVRPSDGDQCLYSFTPAYSKFPFSLVKESLDPSEEKWLRSAQSW